MSGAPVIPIEAVGRLEAVNAELSRLLARPGARLVSTERPATSDTLVLCGVLGAKDVGKSSLINALAGRAVCEPEADVAEGTFGAVVFVHESQADDACRRLSGLTMQRVVTHRIEAVRNLVLVDLPDFSSTFQAHLGVVRAAVPRLDRVVWVWDPIVAGDRSYSERVGRVVKDAANVYVVLNKVDLLLRDEVGEPARRGSARDVAGHLWGEWGEWFKSRTRAVIPPRADQAADSGAFMVSALAPSAGMLTTLTMRAWGSEPSKEQRQAEIAREVGGLVEAELERLRGSLLAPIDDGEVGQIKASNAAAEVESDRTTLVEHFQLQRLSALAGQAGEAIGQEMDGALGARYVEVVSSRLARRGRSDTELAHEVLSRRLEGWPIVPALYWASRGVVRWIGRRIGGDRSEPVGAGDGRWRGSVRDLCRVDGSSLDDRLRGLWGRVKVRLADLLGALREPPTWPEPEGAAEQVIARLEEVGDEADEQVVRACTDGSRRAGWIRRAMVWVVLLWFVVAQPVLHGVLLMLSGMPGLGDGTAGTGSAHLGTTLRGAAIVVGALGPVSLLMGLAVSLLVYVLWLVGMFGRAVRDVRRARGGAAVWAHREKRGLRDGAAGPGEEAGLYLARLLDVLEAEVRRPLAEPVEALAMRLRSCENEIAL